MKWSYAEPFEPPGVVEPYARELMGMTPSEHQAVEASLQRHLADVQARWAAGIQETNEPLGGEVVTNKVFVVPKLPEDEVKERQDQLLAELRGLLGEERWPLAEVRFQERRGVPQMIYSGPQQLLGILIPEGQKIAVQVVISEKGPPKAFVLTGGPQVGFASWELSMFL